MIICDLVFGAFVNTKEDAGSLIVHGSIYLYSENDTILITEEKEQDTNNKTLMLKIKLNKGFESKKAICSPIYWMKDIKVHKIEQVLIRIEGVCDQVVDVNYFE